MKEERGRREGGGEVKGKARWRRRGEEREKEEERWRRRGEEGEREERWRKERGDITREERTTHNSELSLVVSRIFSPLLRLKA